ncbi:hypothetical protein [Dyella silvae]|uniref:hypothetical protein n=1 Tax=Dyella silvae TaxID=2994424 RepID=UPI0022649879|nr:hypothetical protein [Dyella silvae]
MHFEVPKLEKHSLREFAKHYLMIVLSILTALGLEQWIERIHHHHAAEYASAQIDAELRDTLKDVLEAQENNAQRLASMKALHEAIAADVRKGLPDSDINKHIRATNTQFRLSLDWPTLSSQAWDVAVANQSATWIDAEKLRKYAAAYANQREMSSWMAHDSLVAINAPRMVELRTRISLGKDVDPMEFLGVLQQMIGTSSETIDHLKHAAIPMQAALATSTN